MFFLGIHAMHDYLADTLLLHAKNKALALEFAHSVIHVCKAEDMFLTLTSVYVCAKTSKTWFFSLNNIQNNFRSMHSKYP